MTRHVTFPTGQYSCHLEIERASPYVLTGGSAGRIERIAQYLDNSKATEFIMGDRKHVVIYGKYKGLDVMAASTGMGPSSVSITLPEIIEAASDPNLVILRLGTCGGLKDFLNVGDLVISKDKIYRHENVSSWIMKNPFYVARPDADVAEELEKAANNNKQDFQKVHAGKTTTVAELYFTNEIYRDILHNDIGRKLLYLVEDSLSLSMEASVYCALRNKNRKFGINMKMGEIMTVSDVVAPRVIDGEDRRLFEENKAKIEEGQIITGLETLVAMSKRQSIPSPQHYLSSHPHQGHTPGQWNRTLSGL